MLLRSQANLGFEQATLMLKQAEERIQSAGGGSRATVTALFDSDQPMRPDTGNYHFAWNAGGKPTDDNKKLALWEPETHPDGMT